MKCREGRHQMFYCGYGGVSQASLYPSYFPQTAFDPALHQLLVTLKAAQTARQLLWSPYLLE